jgi:cell division protein FtsQ
VCRSEGDFRVALKPKGRRTSMAKNNDFETKKRQLIKKKRRNRLKRRMIIFLFMFVCVGIIFTVLKAPFFNIKTIVCVGQQELSEEQIIQIAGAKTDVNIFSTGVKTMKRRLSENPAIEDCNVRRLYPNKIKIWVRESKACVVVEDNRTFLLASKDGQIIKAIDADDEALVQGIARLANFKPASVKIGELIINNADPVHKDILKFINILADLEMINEITLIDVGDLSNISIDYQNRLYIMLSSYDNLEYKLKFVKKVINENLSEYEKAVMDYRGEKLYVGPRLSEDEQNKDDITEENAVEDETKTQNPDVTATKNETTQKADAGDKEKEE